MLLDVLGGIRGAPDGRRLVGLPEGREMAGTCDVCGPFSRSISALHGPGVAEQDSVVDMMTCTIPNGFRSGACPEALVAG